MAITVDPLTNGDFTRINRADATTGWTMAGAWSMIALNTASQVENTGCMQARVSVGIGSATANFTSRSFENVHIRMWVKLGQSISAGATYGARVILGTVTNHGSWIVYDDSKQVVVYNGWMMMVVDPRKPFDAVVGTAPTDIIAETDAGVRLDFVDANGKDLAISDMLWEGNEVSIEGGTTGARGTFAEWAAADRSNGYGILRDVGGVYYLNAGAAFQDVATGNSYFEDTNQVIIFEDLPMSGSIYRIRHVGNSTGTNHFQLGSSTGSGAAKEGSGGGVIRAAGAAPFRIEAIDTNIDVAAYFGVTMLGPSALYDDQVRNFKVEESAAFTDDTLDFNDANAGDVACWATPANNDALYFGHDERFYEINIDTGTASTGITTSAWEYWNGSSWVTLTDITDGTSQFTVTGPQVVTYSIPDDWAANAIDSDTRYWIRFRIVTSSSPTSPVLDEGSVAMAGDIRWEDPAAEIIGGSITGQGSIRVRNGAFLKKCTISGSNASAKHAAIDLGSADPAADTVRDLTISDNTGTNGILLKGTSTGTTTYNFRSLIFSNNLKHVRVDFPAGATININMLGSSTILVAGDIDNVNSCTVNLVANTAVTFDKMKDNSEVRIFQTSDDSVVDGIEDATAGGPDDRSFTWSAAAALNVYYVIHNWQPGVPVYQSIRVEGFIVPNDDVTIDIQQVIDRNAE